MKFESLRKILPLACGAGLALCMAPAASAQVAFIDGGATYNFPVTTYRDIPYRTVVRQQYDFSCGSAAVATLLNYHYGIPITEAEVFKAMYAIGDKEQIRKVGFSLLDMKRYLESRGLRADGYRATIAQLENSKVPAIAVVVIGRYRHFVVIKGVRNGKVLIGDPAQGLKSYPEDEFVKMWNGIIFAIHSRDDLPTKYNRGEEWTIWPQPSLTEQQLTSTSVTGFTRDLPPLYQVSEFRDIDPLLAQTSANQAADAAAQAAANANRNVGVVTSGQ